MDQHLLKYIQIRHWDYWWGVYHCDQSVYTCPNAVEFSLTDDADGETRFFHFDFYNLSALQDTLRDKDLMEEEHPDYPSFLSRAEALTRGEMDYFIGSLYYQDFRPDLAFCNPSANSGRSLLDLKSPPATPYYAVLFLAEDRPFTPEVLTSWITRLSRPLFGTDFSVEIAHIPTMEEAFASYQVANARR